MDAATYEEIRGRLHGVVICMEGRVSPAVAAAVVELLDAGEPGVALEHLADGLGEDEIAISGTEREHMLDLVRRMQMGDRVPRALDGCPGTARSQESDAAWPS